MKIKTKLGLLAATGITVFAAVAPAAWADYPVGHDNTTYSGHDYSWTHGDPNTGLIPGNTSDGYYYLKTYANGNNVFCEVYSGGNWLVQLEDANKNVLAQNTFTGTGGRVFITNATTGNLYQCRIANTGPTVANGGQIQKDYAELNSGVTGDVTTSDCGGPGPEADPNFGGIQPMEPAPTSGMPVNGCNGAPGDTPYTAGSPQLSPPVQQSYDLGPITPVNGTVTYTFTTTYQADLTALAFYGHQGTNATITIEDASGQVVNGQKWGDMAPNPKTMNQEFVGADAGVQPAGTYKVVYTGPAQTNHDVYALAVQYPQP